MKEFVIKLTEQQLNVIGVALLELPGKTCNPLIAEIQKQIIESEQPEQPNEWRKASSW